ncbi:YbaK/EbsC family protein [Rhizobium glycinendophyticum]|uniref:YbaK/EbsC family protein n=1 Tax=Rhizobium glycinendophyticum TaxID=2589807 RepID=A0A504UJ85_9HYPH|nr:YbaK/EbsC family protein [Rhizobium glycinendophyticum]TPP09376.1 YbaK/EbsC family protein [Rhizobium glycinendophyticum]
MSLETVRQFFLTNAPDISVIVTEASSATVALAAEAHGVEPDQIAKTICLRIGEDVVLVVTAGTKRLDNRKFKDRFGVKPRMLDAEAVVEKTSHPVGGVCPFGLPTPLKVYCDISLKNWTEVVPAGGATNAAVRIEPQRMATLVNAEWADLCQ